MKILLLEDNISLNKAIVKVLQLDKNSVTSYLDGQEVLNNLHIHYDLYILDINVPHISGLELLDIIYKKDNKASVIIISSNNDVESLQKAYKLGCIDYLNKPFHLEELKIKIDKIKPAKENYLSVIQLKDKDITLTKNEKAFLSLLLKNKGLVVTYKMIEEYVYEDKSMSMDGLRALVKRVRLKLAQDIIENVLEEGYILY